MRSDQAPTYRPCRSTSPASRRPGNRPGDRRRRLRDGEPRRADPRLHHVSPTPCTTGWPNSDPTNAPRPSTPAACGAGSGPALTPAASRSHPPIAAPPRGPTERQATRPAPRGAVGRRPERQSDRRLGRRASPDGRLREPRPGHRKAAAEKLITTAKSCPVREITRLGRSLTAWRTEFLARFDHPGVSNGPTECLNLEVKNTKRAARGYRSFTNYRLRLLLNHGLIRDDQATARTRTRRTQVRCRRAGSITAVTPSLNRTPSGCLQLMSISIPRAESTKD
jgi:hypothetical protein